MEFFNTTTKQVESITIIDRKSDLEWTRDLIGNSGGLKFNKTLEMYELDQDEYEWWVSIIQGLDEIEDLTAQAKELLSEEDFEALQQTLYEEGDANDYPIHIEKLTKILNKAIFYNK